ncbi:cobalamin biosynthesis protein CobD [Thioflavicoccus mobilis 8321]|uniref:Cobalamin biosynthesis protein CobD n=1 Tax=Thioflavicoccus mobilis 8321 TaxID=765912 RepID=L0GTN3_9GAMM|nr:adenosylcobinamide-phosphate synthase CbiB [Thioflavicoccus mobilis]AGA89356.1 cobalamin biosynthesis protein CobD [Thioflavicoccus mobilis 8321]
MTLLVVLVGAVLLDRLLGEPRRWHPLEAFGRLALAAEARGYADSRGRGSLLVAVLVLPWVALAALAGQLPHSWLIDLLVLYLAIGWRSLAEHGRAVASALEAGDLPLVRQRVALLVSRDTAALDEEEVAKATVESILENGNDALFGALFWCMVAGAPGVVAYRLVNTLDAMWGYRSVRYRRFGWAAARLDDLMNWVPARLTALAYALVGDTRRALRCWWRQGRHWKSPNAGPVMAAGAGALGIRLGGAAVYEGAVESRPSLGERGAATQADIGRALRLLARAVLLYLSAFAGGMLLLRTIGLAGRW